MTYVVRKTESPPPLDAEWDHPLWARASTLQLDHWYPENVQHRPPTQARVLYDETGLYVAFRVEDRYVRATRTKFQQFVANDSCVEFFVKPSSLPGYFNFEMNCIGTLLLFYVEDPTVVNGEYKKYEKAPKEIDSSIERRHSLEGPIDPEIADPVTWSVAYHVPYAVFAQFGAFTPPKSGGRWRANFYKCADESSKPHWGAWSPIGKKLSFHQPQNFGTIVFE